MTTSSHDNKRIAKNTLALYLRTILTILISLYTSRVVLDTLGETDFGIYNIVGGVVVLFTFINAAMTSATQRFLNIEIGRGDGIQIGRVFSMSMTVHISLALLVLLLAETIGLWFVSTRLNIPADRIDAALWVYQFSVLSTCVNIIRVPYNSAIIAYERMSFYAYIGILENLLRLCIVYLLLSPIFSAKLIVYAVLTFAVFVIIFICHKRYCNRKFQITHYRPYWDKNRYMELLSFSGWNMFGGAANVGTTQGVEIVLNLFFGVVVNAAMGVANQVQMAVGSFLANFQTAFTPQLMRLYAQGSYDPFRTLILQASKFSYYLFYLIALPFVVCAEPILGLWLKDVPEHAVVFTQLSLLFTLVDALSGPLWISAQATGEIRRFQLVTSSIRFLNIPLAYTLLTLGLSAEWALATKVIVNFATHISRIMLLRKMIELPVRLYLISVMGRCAVVTALSAPIAFFLYRNIQGEYAFIGVSILIVAVSLILIYSVGLSSSERVTVCKFVKAKLFARNKND